MSTGLYAILFPALELSLDDKEKLYNTAHSIVGDACAMYEDFVGRQGGELSAAKWKKIRQKENVAVYHDRRPGAGTSNKDINLLLTIGTIVRTLDDALYGVLNPTTEDMRIKTAYVGDALHDGAVLDTILEPTPEDPFQSLSLRWFVLSVPRHVRLVSEYRSALYAEAMGTRTFMGGQRVGYRLLHSVSFPTAPPLPQYDRKDLSICMLMRQVAPDRVQTFVTTYIKIKVSIFSSLVVKSAVDPLLTPWKYMRVAQHKKLTWMLKHKGRFRDGTDRSSILDGTCSVCGTDAGLSKLGAKSSCAVCARKACANCRIKHQSPRKNRKSTRYAYKEAGEDHGRTVFEEVCRREC